MGGGNSMYLLIKALALPPASLVLAMMFGYFLRRWARRTGTTVMLVAAITLYLLSTSFVATRLLSAVEAGIMSPDLSAKVDSDPQAIVILSAGFTYQTSNETTVDQMTLERLRMGARLQRATGLPVLVTGGPSRRDPTAMADLMQQVLAQDFGVEPAWVEQRSRTTNENAKYSAAILHPQNIRSVYVVSQAWHLRRALPAFEAAGFSATPGPSSFTHPSQADINAFLPSAKALQRSYFAVHETLGLAWYRWALFNTDQ